LLHNAKVYTVESTMPWADAVVVSAGRIVFVGGNEEALALAGPSTRVVDLEGRLVLPGFIDAHVHPVSGGVELGECNLNDVTSPDQLREVVRACATRDTTSAWVRGGGFQLPLFAGGNPSRHLLDSLVPGRPALLSSADGHNAWVNTRALELAGVTRETPDPPGGRIERDQGGHPSGTLRESAQRLVSSHLPPHTDADLSAGLARSMDLAGRFGITTWHEASAGEATLRAYHAADSAGRLTVRSLVSITVDPSRGVEQVARLDSLRRRYATRELRPVAAKIFADGVIEGHTGALLEPYLDRAGDRGELNLPPARLDSLVRALDSAGFKVHVHAIGDRAVRVSLDAFEGQRRIDGGAGPRHLMTHVQLIDSSDVGRFASVGVVAAIQALWAYRDSYIRDLTEPQLGPKRSRWLYPFASLERSGAMLAGASDWSVTSMNPLHAIQVGVTRRALDDSTGEAWLPEQRLSLATMVRAYTLGGALASDDEARVGSLAIGKAADLIVLSDNLFEIPAHRIAQSRVVLTLMGGREVWRDSTVIRTVR